MAMSIAMRESVLASIQPTAAELAMDGDYDQLKEILMSLKTQLDECENDCEEDAAEAEAETETEADTSERAAMEWIIQKYVNAADEHGRSALFYACNQNSISMVVLLLSSPFGANPNSLDGDGFPPIYVPCERGFLFIAQMLLKFGADVNHKVLLEDEEEEEDSNYEEEEIENTNHFGVPSVATPLLAAILMKQEAMVKLLLESGANPNVVTDTIGGKKSALEIATEIAPNKTIQNLLYDHGAMNIVACRSAPPKLTWWKL